MSIQSLLAGLNEATRSYHDAKQELKSTEQDMLDARDILLDSFASLMLERPVNTLQDATEGDLSAIVHLAYSADHFKIHQSPNPRTLPGANDFYCYQFPSSPTSTLLSSFSDAANTLGFALSFTHFLTTRYRGQQQKTGSVNLMIRDTEIAEQHRDLLTKVLNALKSLPQNIFTRVKMNGTDVIAEYTGQHWHMYRNGLEILVVSPSLRYTVYDEQENPLDFMKQETHYTRSTQ